MLFLVLLILCYLFSVIVYTEGLFNLLRLLLELNIHIAIYIGSLTITKKRLEVSAYQISNRTKFQCVKPQYS